jgi:hypothetical protein
MFFLEKSQNYYSISDSKTENTIRYVDPVSIKTIVDLSTNTTFTLELHLLNL